MRKVAYPHPGGILMEEFLKPMGITQYRLAKEIGVPQRRIGEIVAGTRGVTADTGLRLARFFGMSEGFWIGLQSDYDREMTKDTLAKVLAKIKPWSGSVERGTPAQGSQVASGERLAPCIFSGPLALPLCCLILSSVLICKSFRRVVSGAFSANGQSTGNLSRHEYLLAYSCKTRYSCPNCHGSACCCSASGSGGTCLRRWHTGNS